MRGEIRPVMAWGNAPMLPHVIAPGLGRSPEPGIAGALRGDGNGRPRWRRASSPGFRMPTSAMPALRGRRDRWRPRPRRAACATNCSTRLGGDREGLRLPDRAVAANRWPAPRHCRRQRPAKGRSYCWIITTIAPRVARWTRRSCSARSCARGSTMSRAFAIYDPEAVPTGDRRRIRRATHPVARRQNENAGDSPATTRR